MEDIRDAVFNQIDIVITRDYAVIDRLTKIEIQAKVLGLNIIAPESYLTVLRMPKKHLIEFILQLNLFYAEEDMNDMSETQEGINNDQHGRYGTDNFYGYYGDMNDYQQYWQHNQDQHYYQYSAQDQGYWQQWQNGMLFQQWNGQYQNDWNESN